MYLPWPIAYHDSSAGPQTGKRVFSWNSWLKPRFSNSRDLGGHFLLYESSGNQFPTHFVTKTCKKPFKMKISNSSRQFPRVYRGFPTLSNPSRGSSMMSEGSQPVAPTLHVKKKLITECREKSDHRVPRKKCMSRKKCRSFLFHKKRWLVIDDWWLIIDHGWLMIDNWWLMTDDWWLMIDEWWVMIDDWW